ncbi:MAG: hypothetical protein II864_02765 [Prevotella sp.]|nr:hypothetical protein [Prevotella sp.]
MKKVYEIPEIEVTLLETTELLQASLSVYSDEENVIDNSGDIKSRLLFFEAED